MLSYWWVAVTCVAVFMFDYILKGIKSGASLLSSSLTLQEAVQAGTSHVSDTVHWHARYWAFRWLYQDPCLMQDKHHLQQGTIISAVPMQAQWRSNNRQRQNCSKWKGADHCTFQGGTDRRLSHMRCCSC